MFTTSYIFTSPRMLDGTIEFELEPYFETGVVHSLTSHTIYGKSPVSKNPWAKWESVQRLNSDEQLYSPKPLHSSRAT